MQNDTQLTPRIEINKMKTDKILSGITEILQKYSEVTRAVLYGSRARGDNGERSDYDIAIFGSVFPKSKALIAADMEELPTLLKIDVIYFNELEEGKFKENIKKDGIIFYDRKAGK